MRAKDKSSNHKSASTSLSDYVPVERCGSRARDTSGTCSCSRRCLGRCCCRLRRQPRLIPTYRHAAFDYTITHSFNHTIKLHSLPSALAGKVMRSVVSVSASVSTSKPTDSDLGFCMCVIMNISRWRLKSKVICRGQKLKLE